MDEQMEKVYKGVDEQVYRTSSCADLVDTRELFLGRGRIEPEDTVTSRLTRLFIVAEKQF